MAQKPRCYPADRQRCSYYTRLRIVPNPREDFPSPPPDSPSLSHTLPRTCIPLHTVTVAAAAVEFKKKKTHQVQLHIRGILNVFFQVNCNTDI